MQVAIYILFAVIGWILLGSFALGAVDRNLEIANWKKQAIWWLVLLSNLLWPIIAIRYWNINKKKK